MQTKAQQYANNAAARVDRAAAHTTQQKALDLQTMEFLRAIASGECVVIDAAEHQRLREVDESARQAEVDDETAGQAEDGEGQ